MAIVLHEHGEPAKVARCEAVELPPLGLADTLVEILAAPINPADLNVIEGKYPVRPSLPGTPGVEGVGVVREIGSGVTAVEAGDHVLLPHGLGTWREAAVVDASKLIVVPHGVDVMAAAMLKINPATALRMLRDFVALESGAWIV